MSLNYFQVGSRDNIVVSNSSMSCINPEEGGDIEKFFNFFIEREEEKQSVSLYNGKMLHSYIENPDKFSIEPTKPTEMMAGLLEEVVKQLVEFRGLGFQQEIETAITSSLKKADAAQAEIAETIQYFERLGEILGLPTTNAISVFRKARSITNAYKSYTENTLLSNILGLFDGKEGKELKYLRYLLSTREKISVKADDYEIINGCINSLNNHKFVAWLLDLKCDELDEVDDYQRCHELPVYWKEFITFEDGTKFTLSCKALLDNLKISHSKKKIIYTDLKSTKGSIYTFQNAFEYYRYYRQFAFYRRAIERYFRVTFPDLGYTDYTLDMYCVPVETKPFYKTGAYVVDITWLAKGTLEAKALLERIAWHLRTGEDRFSQEEAGEEYRPLKFKAPESTVSTLI